MVNKEILIHKNINDVYDAVEKSLKQTFKVKGPLLGAEFIHKMSTVKGEVKIRQVVSKSEKNEVLSFESFWGRDKVITTYSFREDGSDFTVVQLKEEAYSSSTLRNYNYMFMSLPVLRAGSIKKLDKQLVNLKHMLEGENE